MPTNGNTLPRPPRTRMGRRSTCEPSYHRQRPRRAHHSRPAVAPSVTALAASRQAANSIGEKQARLAVTILDSATGEEGAKWP